MSCIRPGNRCCSGCSCTAERTATLITVSYRRRLAYERTNSGFAESYSSTCTEEDNVCPAGTNGISSQTECPHQTGYSQSSPKNNFFQWTKGDCTFKVKVRLDGMIAMIHEPEGISRVVKYVDNSVGNMNFFHVSFYQEYVCFLIYSTNMAYIFNLYLFFSLGTLAT